MLKDRYGNIMTNIVRNSRGQIIEYRTTRDIYNSANGASYMIIIIHNYYYDEYGRRTVYTNTLGVYTRYVYRNSKSKNFTKSYGYDEYGTYIEKIYTYDGDVMFSKYHKVDGTVITINKYGKQSKTHNPFIPILQRYIPINYDEQDDNVLYQKI